MLVSWYSAQNFKDLLKCQCNDQFSLHCFQFKNYRFWHFVLNKILLFKIKLTCFFELSFLNFTFSHMTLIIYSLNKLGSYAFSSTILISVITVAEYWGRCNFVNIGMFLLFLLILPWCHVFVR